MTAKTKKTWSMIFLGIVVLSTILSLTANYLSIREYYKTHKTT